MADSILESVLGLAEDKSVKSIKKIDNTLKDLYNIKSKEFKTEEKERKEETKHRRRLAQLGKRQKSDAKKEPILKQVLNDKAKKEKKSNPLLGLTLLGLGGLAVALSDENVRKKINEKKKELEDHLKKEIEKKKNELIEEIKKRSSKAINDAITKLAGNDPSKRDPQGTQNTQRNDPFGNMDERLLEIRNIGSEMSLKEDLYKTYLMQPGGDDESDKAMRDFYYDSNLIVKEYAGYLEQHINMSEQLANRVKQFEQSEPGTIAYDMLKKQIKNLETNIKIKEGQLKVGQEKLKEIKENEKRMIENARAANSGRQLTDYEQLSVFQGSKFQTGGKIRKGNGAPTEDLVLPDGLVIQKRQNGGKIFLHWAGSTYTGASPNYHATIQGDGSVAKTRDYNTFGGGHTSERNSEGIGISLAAMAGATTNDFGKYPVKQIQYEGMAKLCAKILRDWGYTPSYVNERNVPTHAEAGRQGDSLGNYGPVAWGGDGSRWDLWKLYEGDSNGSGGPKIRGMIKSAMGMSPAQLQQETETNVPEPNMASQGIQSLLGDTTIKPDDNLGQKGLKALGNLGIFASEVFGGIGSFLKDEIMGAQQLQTGGHVGAATKHIMKDEALSSLTKGKNDYVNMGGKSSVSNTPYSSLTHNTPVHTYDDKHGVSSNGRGSTYYDSISNGNQSEKMGDTIRKIHDDAMLHTTVRDLNNKYRSEIPNWTKMSGNQKTALISMGYNEPNFYSSDTFAPKLKASLKAGDMHGAADNLTWGGPSEARIQESQKMMRQGPKFVGKQTGGQVGFQNASRVYQEMTRPTPQVVIVKRRAKAAMTPPIPQQSAPIMMPMGGGVNSIDMINDMFITAGMS